MFLRSRIFTVVLVPLVGGLLFLAFNSTLRSRAARTELASLQNRISEEERTNERMSRLLERMRQPDWLALLARSRLNFKQEGETVVFVYKSEKTDILSPPQQPLDGRPNWRAWWDWLLKR